MRSRVRADMILHALQKATPQNEKFFAEVKTGPTTTGEHVRLDAIWVRCSWTKPRITGFEIKVDRGDFLHDDKWPAYKTRVHRFYFVCPAGLIKPEELDPDVGLYWYYPDTGILRVRKAAPHRDVPLDVGILYYLVQWRVEPHRHPFFSDEREYLEAWLQDKAERRRLGQMVRSRIAERLEQAERRVQELEAEVWRLRERVRDVDRIREIAEECGINTWRPDWPEQLREAITGVHAEALMPTVRALRYEVERLERLAGIKGGAEGACA